MLNEHFEGEGERISKLGLEGIVSKRRDLPYQPGRTKRWAKVRTLTAPR
jgi:bifunctional non-homologous end joining protein LigD